MSINVPPSIGRDRKSRSPAAPDTIGGRAASGKSGRIEEVGDLRVQTPPSGVSECLALGATAHA